jgi:hypothetical protein
MSIWRESICLSTAKAAREGARLIAQNAEIFALQARPPLWLDLPGSVQ